MATLDERIRAALNLDGVWDSNDAVAAFQAIGAVLSVLPDHPGPPINRMVCADTIRSAMADAIGIPFGGGHA